MATDRRVVLTADSGELRRRLGPTTWMVFEELVLASSGPVDARVGRRCRSGRWHPGSVSPKTPSLAPSASFGASDRSSRPTVADEYRRVRDWLLHAHDPDLDQLRRRHPITGIHNNASRVTHHPPPHDAHHPRRPAHLAAPRVHPPAMTTIISTTTTTSQNRQVPALSGSAHVAGDDLVRLDRGGDGAVLHPVPDRRRR